MYQKNPNRLELGLELIVVLCCSGPGVIMGLLEGQIIGLGCRWRDKLLVWVAGGHGELGFSGLGILRDDFGGRRRRLFVCSQWTKGLL
jgi:hypothetical protein